MKNLPVTLWTAILVLGADLASKAYIKAAIAPGDYFWVIPGVLRITDVRNPGGAFGILANDRWLFLGVGALAAALILWYTRRVRQPATLVALGLLLGGTLGNMVDRWQNGRVVDFLDFRVWPVFNLADVAVVGGIILLIWLTLAGKENWSGGG